MQRVVERPALRGFVFIGRLLKFHSASEKRMAAAGFLLFFLAWAAAQSFLNADRALHFDVIEAYAWGKEFQLGYYKHGPFWAWVAGAWFSLFPNTNTSFVVLEALNAALGLFGAWMLIGLFTKGWERHAATLLLVATPFYTFQAYKYNANTIFISLWPWTLYFFIRSADLLSKRDAFAFGVLAAACILSKYYAVLLLAACAISLIVHPNGRRFILSCLPWIAGGIFFILVSPHVLWSFATNAPAVSYAMDHTGKGWLFTARHVWGFIVDLVLFQSAVAALIFSAWAWGRQGRACEEGEPLPRVRHRFLAVLVLAPPLLTIVAGVIFQLRIEAIMAIGIFPLMPLFLMQCVGSAARRCFYLAGGAAIAVTLVTLAGAPFAGALMASKKAGPSFAFPYRELAASVTELWRSEQHTPLRYIGAETIIANGVSFYSPDRPSSFVDLDYARALWVTEAKLERDGLLIACVHEDAACLSKASPFLRGRWKQTSLKVHRNLGTRRMPEVTFDVFIVPPLQG